MRNLCDRLHARLMLGTAVCFISVGADGVVDPGNPGMTVHAGGDPTAISASPEVSADPSVRDPQAPPETEEEKAARLAAETPEQKTAREAAEAAAVEKTPEEKAAEEAAKTDEQKAAEAEAANKAWLERDKSKDVPVTEEQKADIAKLAKTPEQISAMEEFTLEMNTTNELSPASKAKAAELWGVTPDMVDRYVASVQNQNNAAKAPAAGQYDDAGEDPAKWSPAMQGQFKARMDALEGVAGGADNWKAFAGWADTNLSAGEKEALQAAISANPIVGATVAKEFIGRWKAEGGAGGPADLSRGAGMGGRQAEPAVKGFASKQEQNAAINDPRYEKDAAYRQSVDAKMIATTFPSNVEKSFYAGTGGMMGT